MVSHLTINLHEQIEKKKNHNDITNNNKKRSKTIPTTVPDD